MAGVIVKACLRDLYTLKPPLVRFRVRNRGTPPGVAKTLKQKLEELNYQDPELTKKINIGFGSHKKSRSVELSGKIAFLKAQRANPDLERAAREKELILPLDKVKEEWVNTIGPEQMKTVAEHYGVFEHLFGDAYFYPRVMLDIAYKQPDSDLYAVVHTGNVIKPAEAASVPTVTYKSSPDSLWTLILTAPDSHLHLENKEYVFWFIGNIPGNNINEGEVIFDYLQPFPPRGTGYHRFVYILYKQTKKMDYSQLMKKQPSLEDRTFSTTDFYRERQDDITPAGLAFFQSDWDPSVTEFFHNVLDTAEPVYEYDFAPHYLRPQKWFPKKQPFNLYLDKYRDPKQIAKEYLMKKLKKTHPFYGPTPPLKYPNAVLFPKDMPSWLQLEKTKDRLGWGRIQDY